MHRRIRIYMLLLCTLFTLAETSCAQQTSDEQSVTLLFAGDLMQHQSQIDAALASGNGRKYDYTECFQYIRPEIESADVAICNFEVTLAGKPYAGYPRFCAPDEYLQASIDAGFDVLMTANNHACDTWKQNGVQRTIQMMDRAGIAHMGTYLNARDRQDRYPLLVEKNGMRIVLLNGTYLINYGTKCPAPCIVNLLDTVQWKKDIQKAKAMNPDVIIALPHWGTENVLQADKSQQQFAQWLFRQGVDHVIGGHPHMVQPIEVRQNAQGDPQMLVYSLGNIVSNMTRTCNDGGLIVKMTLTKKDGRTRMTDSRYSLFWVSRPEVSRHTNFRIYPVSVPPTMLNAQEKKLFDATLKAEREMFARDNVGIQEYQIPFPTIQ